MTMQMNWMIVRTFITHYQAIPSALPQSNGIGLRKGFAVDHPMIEIAMSHKFRTKDQRYAFVRLPQFLQMRELLVIPQGLRRGKPSRLALLVCIFNHDTHTCPA